MRLSEFILAQMERILVDFEAFARSLVPPDSMDIAALRDHAQEMLTVVAQDLDTPQTRLEGSDKSLGRSDADGAMPDTPAQEHGSGRMISGFTVGEMVSEYRAMRASVIRLWLEAEGTLEPTAVEDLIRFNEAMDQALAESTSRFSDDLDRTKETFLGILGHDLRTPLGAIITSARFMVEEGDLPQTAHELTSRILSSGLRMNHMVDDLLDFTRSRMGAAIPIVRVPLDLAHLAHDAVAEVMAARPTRVIRLDTSGALLGSWDGGRLSQVLSNLISNADSHGAEDTPISVAIRGELDEVTISVHNMGKAIPKEHFKQIFDPLRRAETTSRDANHLGLGLYIADQIVRGHGGTIEVHSEPAKGTTFLVHLPREAPTVHAARERARATPERRQDDRRQPASSEAEE